MNIKKMLKNNKYSVIAIAIFIILIIVGYALYKLLFPNAGTPIYGNRLDGIEAVDASINENGKIINVTVIVKERPKKEDAITFSKIILENSTQDQINYFDFQIFVKSEKDDYKSNSIIGYKNKIANDFTFSIGVEETKE